MSHDAASLLEALGATPDPERPNHYFLSLEPLGLTSVFGAPLRERADLQVLSEHAFCFLGPLELAALGPLWVETLEQKSEILSMLADALARLKKTLARDAADMVAWGLTEPHLLEPYPHVQAIYVQDESRLTYQLRGARQLALTWVDGVSAVALDMVVEIPADPGNDVLKGFASDHLQRFKDHASPPAPLPVPAADDLQTRVAQLEERLATVLEETAEIQRALRSIQGASGEDISQAPAPLDGLSEPPALQMPQAVPIAPFVAPEPPAQSDPPRTGVPEAELPVVISMSDLEPVESAEQPVVHEDADDAPSALLHEDADADQDEVPEREPVAQEAGLDPEPEDVPPSEPAEQPESTPEAFEDAPPTIAMDLSHYEGKADSIISMTGEETDNVPSPPSTHQSVPLTADASGFEEPATVAMDLAAPPSGMGFESGSAVKGTSQSPKMSETAQGLSDISPEGPQTKEDPPQDTEDKELAALFAEVHEPEAGILDTSDVGDPFSEPDRVHEVAFEDDHDDGPTAIGNDFLDSKTEAYVLGSADSAIVGTDSQFDSDLGLPHEAGSSVPQSFPADPLKNMLPEDVPPLETSAPTAISPLRDQASDQAETDGVFSDGEEEDSMVVLVLRHEKARNKLTQKLGASIPNLLGVESTLSISDELDDDQVQTVVYVRPPAESLAEIIEIKEKHPSLKVVVVTNDNRFVDVPEIDLMLPLVNQVSQVAQSILDGLHLL